MSDSNYSTDIKLVTITKQTLINNIIKIGLNGLFIGYYSKYYFEMDTDLIDKFSSRILFILLINGYWISFNNILILFLNYCALGTIMLESQYNNYLMLNSSIYKNIHKLVKTIACVCAMILVPIFIPFDTNHCHEYSTGLCFFGRWNAFFGIISIIIFGIYIVFCVIPNFVLLCTTKCCCKPSHAHTNTNTSYSRAIQGIQNMVMDHSILSAFKDYISICPICISDATDGNSDFVKLLCGHKFHKTCMMEFMSSDLAQNCPECRQPIDSNNVVDFHTTESVVNAMYTDNAV